MPDAFAEFSGQKAGYSFSYTLALGTDPGVARIVAPRGQRINPIDVLDVWYQGTRMRLFDAALINPSSPSSTTSAPAEEWTIEDRRWKWRYGEGLDGHYNVEQEDGSLLREMSPRQLASLCFDALGEQGYDVSALPREPRPPKYWRAADPKGELDRLCSEFGCAPAYNPFTNEAYIVKLGKGTAPPNRPHKSRADATISPTRPDAIRLVGGNTLFQSALKLGEWVGLEVDGTFKPIDQLSYAPAGGWKTVGPLYLSSLNTTYTDPATGETLYHRELAQRSVWRCARITEQAAGGISPEALKGQDNEPQAITDLGPFTGSRLEKDPLTGERMPIYARGTFADPLRFGNINTQPKTRYPGTLQINSNLRIVTFDQVVFKWDENMNPVAADDLELIAAYEVHTDGVAVRHEQVRQGRGKKWSAGEERIHRAEIVREIIEKKASATGALVDNHKEIKKQAQYYIDETAERYVDKPAANVTYNGIFKHVCDGALRSITWQFSVSSAPTTTCTWNCESHKSIRPWEDRREYRTQRQIESAQRRAAGDRQIQASKAGAVTAGGVSVALNL